jgi:glycerophosphoryl diester phosphodiesterase
MRNSVRALKAMVAVAVALILAAAPAAHANPLDDIVIAHRAGAISRYGEGTLASYKHSVANHADILDGDIHWTKDSPNDSDKLGSILVIHDSTLDRITNCKGKVSSWLWTSIRDKCRTDVGKQRLIRLKDLSHMQSPSGSRWRSNSSKRRSRMRKPSSCGRQSNTPKSSWKPPHTRCPH